jgi:hypothetical protein
MTSVHRRACQFALAALLAAGLAGPSAATAMEAPGAGGLSPRLAKLARPAVRSAPDAAQARKLGLPVEGPGSLVRRGGRVFAYVRFDQGALARLDALRGAGAEIADANRRYQTVTVAVRPADLRAVASVPGVAGVTQVWAPIVNGLGPSTSSYTPCFGKETSEGDAQVGADRARTEFEVDGSGETVGILSDSFDRDSLAPTGAAEDTASADLPGTGNPCGHTTPVDVLEDLSGEEATDEGRAMAQIVHDLAPGAAIDFATAFPSEMSFIANIKALAEAGAKVIVDDISYFEEPFFQEGPVGVAIGEATANHEVAYFSSAGNDNLISAGHDIASWEAPAFRDSGGCPAAVEALPPAFNPTHCMDFDPSGPGVDRTFGITVSPGATLIVDLQWAEPWKGVTSDLDAFLLNAEGKLIADSAEDNVLKTQRPVELLGWENETGSPVKVRLAINRFGGGTPRLKFALLENGSGVTATEYPESAGGDTVGPTIFGHTASEDVMSVGAIRYDQAEAPEPYSSRGPATHYFGPVEGTTPAAELGSPAVLSKPDLVATDGGANTFFGSCASGTWRFFGTSAAAPHAAAVAALQREAVSSASPAEVKDAQRAAAVPVGAFPPTAVGSGLLDAAGALEEMTAPVAPGAPVVEAPAPGPCAPPRQPESSQPTTTPLTGPVTSSPTPAKRPKTFFRLRPRKVVRTHHQRAKVVFRFGSNEGDVSFACRIDNGLFRTCPERLVKRLAVGWHSVRVSARRAEGEGDRTPAFYRFRVKRVG